MEIEDVYTFRELHTNGAVNGVSGTDQSPQNGHRDKDTMEGESKVHVLYHLLSNTEMFSIKLSHQMMCRFLILTVPNPGSEEEAARGACRPTRPDAVHGPHLRGAHRTVPTSSPDTRLLPSLATTPPIWFTNGDLWL